MRIYAPLRRAIARARPVVPKELRALVRSARTLRGAGPVIGQPGFRRVLVVAPHPDDESLGCGGTIALMSDAGASVTTLTATDGESTRGAAGSPEETARLRRAEAERAAARVGAATRFLGLTDGGLAGRRPELTDALGAAIAELNPEAVFAPWLLDGGSDHRAVAGALAEALGDGPEPAVWGYEVWTALMPNRIVPIGSVIERKRAAIEAHETAARSLDLGGAAEGLARWRALGILAEGGWAEAFRALSAAQYKREAAELAAEG